MIKARSCETVCEIENMNLVLTTGLDSDQWAEILVAARKQQFKLTITTLPGCSLPVEMVQNLKSIIELKSKEHCNGALLIYSNSEIGSVDLNWLILESMPGEGKTELLRAMMQKNDFTKASHDNVSMLGGGASKEPDIHQNIYYDIPATMGTNMKKILLLKAFHEGAVVIMDEMNSACTLEKLINALLMGRTPKGKKAMAPGFTILSTQNPASMGSREEQTEAQSTRAITLKLPRYAKDEIEIIIRSQMFADLKNKKPGRSFDKS